MKFTNITKLLLVLLCICVFLSACNANGGDTTEGTGATAGTTTAATTGATTSATTGADVIPEISDEELLGTVASNRDNFFKLFVPTMNNLSSAVRPAGKVDHISQSATRKLVIYYNDRVDTKNNITETYDIFNTDEGKVVLSVKHTYANGHYDAFDWNNLIVKDHLTDTTSSASDNEYVFESEKEKNYPASVLDVTLHTVGRFEYICVREATVTPIEDAVHKENPDGAVYEITVKYTYYDMCGTKINELNYRPNIGTINSNNVQFGSVIAVFNTDTGKLIKTYSTDSDNRVSAYDFETEKYGYFSGNSVGGDYVEVYNKQTDKFIARYYVDVNYGSYDVFLLHNGDLLVQYITVVNEGEPYDYYDGRNYYTYAHSIFDASTGKATDAELAFIVESLEWGENVADDLAEKGIAITENVRNLAKVTPIENKMAKDVEALVLDNDMTVLYKFERIIPEHGFDIEVSGSYTLGFEILQSGDYLVYLDTPINGVNRAVVKADGTVRTYVKSGYNVVGGFIYDGVNAIIYDYDMKVVYKFFDDEFSYKDSDYKYYGELGGVLVLERKTDNGNGIKYSFTKSTNAQGYEIKEMFEGKKISVVDSRNENYLIVIDVESGNYVLYNTNFAHILTSENQINVYEAEGYYIIDTYSNVLGQSIIYTVKE